MRDHDALRLGCRTGGEDDLERVVAIGLHGLVNIGRVMADRFSQVLEFDRGYTGDLFCMFARTDHQFRRHLPLNTARKVRRSPIIQRYGDRTAQGTTEESRHPLGRILTPEQDAVSFSDSARLQVPCYLRRRARHISVTHPLYPKSPTLDKHPLRAVLQEVINQPGYRAALHVIQCSAGGWFTPRPAPTADPSRYLPVECRHGE